MNALSKRALWLLPGAIVLFFPMRVAPANGQQSAVAADSSSASAASSDPLLQAMREELERSKSQLKMENVPAPYYIEYHLWDLDEYDAEAAFGALRFEQRSHGRSLRVVVRVGDYKQDSYYPPGMGAVNIAPVDNDPIALRWQLWIATDQAYKAASQALAMKKAAMREYTNDQPFDDFAHAPAVQSIEPLAKLDFDSQPWRDALESSTALFRTDPKIESLTARLQFRAVNRYFVNTEGTVTREGYAGYFLNALGSTQAADGMRLERSPYFAAAAARDLPTPEHFHAEVAKMVATLKSLREAPVVDEDYRGPVLFSPDAASDVFNGLVGANILGVRPKPGDSARTLGEYASNYKSRVLPSFLSVEDDPTAKTFEGKTLVGSYDTDDDGVRAVKVPVIKDGLLVNYLLGREPIRDFPESNGHGRAGPSQFTTPSIGNLIVESKQALSPDQLKEKLIQLCRDDGKQFGYFVDTLGGPGYEPRLLYRVYQDGREELVRGAVFDELDTRALRNELVAAGNDLLVQNREAAVPTTVISPSILFDDLEVKRTDAKNAKLPEYPPPDLSSSR
ncbi:MAG TPA: metallopeptidase TldD-related protein [Candidatus Acidoferrales bacterium]|nr:metallopeptidase TldD-related protein [Candidatus Acidoferrales bacterium]